MHLPHNQLPYRWPAERLCEPDTVRGRPVAGHAEAHRILGAVGCSSQSETMLTDLFFPRGESGLAGKLEAATSRQCTCTLFLLHRFNISPRLCENISSKRASCAHPDPPLKSSCFCKKSSVKLLSESIQLPGHKWARIISSRAPLYCLPVTQSHSLGKAVFTFHSFFRSLS